MDRLKRGDLVVVAMAGDYGKPRPALVVQANLFNETHTSVTLVPVTSTLVDAPLFRLTVAPSPGNGLRALSQIMIDKVTTVARAHQRPLIVPVLSAWDEPSSAQFLQRSSRTSGT